MTEIIRKIPNGAILYDNSIIEDVTDDLFVPESSNSTRILPSEEVITVEGNGIAGFLDGSNNHSFFYFPHSVSFSPNGNFIVADRSNGSIREI